MQRRPLGDTCTTATEWPSVAGGQQCKLAVTTGDKSGRREGRRGGGSVSVKGGYGLQGRKGEVRSTS